MQRFYLERNFPDSFTISDEWIIHQLTRVLRSKIGDQVIFFNGDGSEYLAEIVNLEKKSIYFGLKVHFFPQTEPAIEISLYQSLPNKLEKIEYILQKWIEIGIRRFLFFRSERSQKLIISESKVHRLNQIARESVEQCGWVLLPEIFFLDSFSEVIQKNNIWVHLTLDTTGESLWISSVQKAQNIGIWVGPEWWWSEGEKIKMREYDFIFAHFGTRVMRTETAGGMIAFSLMYQ